MSAIFGFYHLTGRPAESDLLTHMEGRLRLVDRHEVSHSVVGPVGLGSAVRAVAAEVEGARGMANDARAKCWIAFDGRLDNRRALLADTGGGEDEAAVAGDAELVLRAYRQWDLACPDHLIGDFAFALWDAATQRLFCARDVVGARAFYYTVANGAFWFASQIPPLFTHDQVSTALDYGYLADYLGSGLSLDKNTPYQAITRLQPGHFMVVERKRVLIERYWQPEEQDKIQLPREEGYFERFRELFRDAVRCRLRGRRPVWADLSGGMDSSSIVCMAHEILRAEAGSTRLATTTMVFNEAYKSDERRWSEPVRQKYGLDAHYMDADRHYPLQLMGEGAPWWDEPHAQILFYPMFRQYRAMLTDGGAGALLTGIGAEAVVTGKSREPIYLADRLRRLQFRTLWKETMAWQRVLKIPLSNLWLAYCLRPLLRPGLVEYGSVRYEVPAWVSPRFAKKWDLERRVMRGHAVRCFRSPADQWQYEKLGRIASFLYRGYADKAFDVRYPFLDRRLMEFMLAIPWTVKVPRGPIKSVLRHAMQDLLPEEVLNRRENSTTGHWIYLAVTKKWREIEALVRSSALVELGLVDRDQFYQAAKMARHGHAKDLHLLISSWALEMWLQAALAMKNPSSEEAGSAGKPLLALGA